MICVSNSMLLGLLGLLNPGLCFFGKALPVKQLILYFFLFFWHTNRINKGNKIKEVSRLSIKYPYQVFTKLLFISKTYIVCELTAYCRFNTHFFFLIVKCQKLCPKLVQLVQKCLFACEDCSCFITSY